MLKHRVIACLDINKGRVVKGVEFRDLIDAGDPVEAAIKYDHDEVDELCILDISASHEDRSATFDVIEKITSKCFMPVTVGGGVRTLDDVRELLLRGADKVSINSSAVSDPSLIRAAADVFGSQCIVVAIDAKSDVSRGDDKKHWKVCTHGGHRDTDIDAIEFAKRMEEMGAGEILLTSMDNDGTRKGYDLDLTRNIADVVSIPVIASGGVGSLQDMVDGIIIGGASAVLVASIFHFGIYTVQEAKDYMHKNGVQVRLYEKQ